VAYDASWVEREYLPRLVYLSRCMKEGRFPCKADYQTFRSTYDLRSKGSGLRLRVTPGAVRRAEGQGAGDHRQALSKEAEPRSEQLCLGAYR
jgi:hypothetical protein